jgi:hypothetical protein
VSDPTEGADPAGEAMLEVRLTKAQAIAAGAVLRGYLSHQRERLGDQAATNPSFRNVAGALQALEAQIGSPVDDERSARPT